MNRTDLRRLYRPTPFFLLDLVLTWVPLWLLALGTQEGWFERGTALLIVAGVSATVSAVLFVHASGNRRFARDFWIRAVDPFRISPLWWLIILGSQLLINVVAILLSVLGTGSIDQLVLSEAFLSAPVGFLLFIFVFGPLPEELGWRGYGLDALRSRMNLLQASLLLAAIWAVWHLPLVFVEGSFQRGLLEYPPAFISYFLAFVPTSILMSWIYYRTGRSTLSAILFHFAGNAAGELFHMALPTRLLQMVLSMAFAAVVLWIEWPMFSQREFWLELSGRFGAPRTRRGRGATACPASEASA